jgi:NTP pyrophosphatase (non-canonical NTP hydrolase)
VDVLEERGRQTETWGVQSLSWPEWILILTEEVGGAAQAASVVHWNGAKLDHLREELVQVAAVAVQIVEAIDAMETEQPEGQAA